ncbi:MAG: GNAT family N-acetyltransferase [Betaproteobacteria bacterium]|nr:GNAT family N-acetyltransferase [Betaproteobacteria bacterium]
MGAPAHVRKQLLALLDEEFVTLRGRGASLAARYPDLFGANGCADFHWLTQDDAPVSMLVTRALRFTSGDEAWTGAAVGWVHTVRSKQGQGLASALLTAVARRMADEGKDFMLLWAHQHGYYRAQGYRVADAGVLAESAITNANWASGRPSLAAARRADLAMSDLAASDLNRLQRLADADARGGTPFAQRTLRRIPLPFDRISISLAGSRSNPTAYLLLGHQRDWITVLEGCGDPSALRGLTHDVARQASAAGTANIRVNARRDSSLHRALSSALVFQPKPLAMYLPFSPKIDLYHAVGWSFPYFDRM